jgi:hypothetical protein
MTSTGPLIDEATRGGDAAQQRRAVVVAQLIGSIAGCSAAGRLASIGQLVALSYTSDEIECLEHDATRMLHTLTG